LVIFAMSDQVDEIKGRVDIVSVIGERIELKKAGRNYKALCPFHGEKTPSFMVSPELQMYKCFGCGKAGDCFTFLMEYEGMEFREALKFLADRVGVKLVSYQSGAETEKERLFKINDLAKKFYHYILLNHPSGKAALNYLTGERGLTLNTIKNFEIGFSPDVPNILKKFLVDKKKFTLKDLETGGFGFGKGAIFIDKFRGRVIFPLSDHRGNCVGFAGRILPGENKDLAKYINSPETPVYHKSKLLFGLNVAKGDIKSAGEVIIVEGELDMISSYQAGIKNVVAIKGSALTEDQVRLIKRFADKVILALDSDFAGNVAARRGIVVAQREGLEIRVATFKDYKDPDEAARGNPKYYRKALASAVGVWDYLVDSVFTQLRGETGEEKAKVSREIVPILASIPDKIVQAHYIDIVAKKLGVSSDAVSEQVVVNLKSGEMGKVDVGLVAARSVEKTRRQLLEERFLTLAFATDPTILSAKENGKLVATPVTRRILEEYINFSQTHADFSISAFAEGLPKELLESFAEIAMRDIGEVVEDPGRVGGELELVLTELQITDFHHQLEELGAKMRNFDQSGEREKSKAAQKHFGELTVQLSQLEGKRGRGIILQEG
jgi:DNA primase